ncbi:uncharacterized protein LOC125179488 [Hyalella azteca]|uniref:Uncharacterized protein LOC125179488 n=1 Tax=Hyalella azteca TaxID=294128 RepID=A0A979FXJ2_HYAAZ|nr:uncharacterized protein LOC125179488 [Hyalella azteca]
MCNNMRDLMQRGSFRGKNILETVSRALSPSRNRSKSPSADKNNSDVSQSNKTRNGQGRNGKNREKLDQRNSSTKSDVTRKEKDIRNGGNKQKKTSSNSSSEIKNEDSRKSSEIKNEDSRKCPAIETDTIIEEKGLQDQRSSSGASSQASGDSTPTKPTNAVSPDNDDNVPDGNINDEREESVYMSRKLLFRKMIELEVKELGKPDCSTADVVSVADSWDDLEENFSKIYEPIPARVAPSKKQKKKTKSNTSLPKGYKPEDRKIQNDEVFYNSNYFLLGKSEKPPTAHPQYVCSTEMRDSGFSPTSELEVFAEVHRSLSDSSDSDINNEEPDGSPSVEADYETRTDLYRNIRNLRNSLARRQQQKKRDEDVDSWKSMTTDDEPVYVSRSEILSRHELSPLPISLSSAHGSSLARHSSRHFISRSEILARLDKVQELDECRARSPEAGSVSSHDSWSVKEHDLLFDKRIIPFSGQKSGAQDYTSIQSNGSYMDFEADLSCSEIESRECCGLDSKRRRHEQREAAAAELQRRVMAVLATQQHIAPSTKTKVMDIIKQHIDSNNDSLDYEQFEIKNEEIRNKLKEALAHDWETLSNINLGLIYVPMEENLSLRSKKSAASRDVSDYDTFGSLDSLIFEPKVPSEDAISEASEDSVCDNSQLSISLSALPQSKYDVETEFKSIGKDNCER